jgi:inositol transport system substrate-binding protein
MSTGNRGRVVWSLTISLVLIVSLLLVACGATEAPAQPTKAPAQPTKAEVAPTKAEVQPTEAPAVSAKCQECVACQKKKDWVIGYTPRTTLSPPWLEGIGGSVDRIQQLNEEYKECGLNITMEVQVPSVESDAAGQTAIIENFVAKKVDFIVWGPTDEKAITSWTLMANEAGIPVGEIVSLVTPDEGEMLFYITNNDVEGGYDVGKYACEQKPNNILMLQGVAGHYSNEARTTGVMKALAECPEVKLLAQQNADWERDKGMKVTEDWIQTYGDEVEYILALNDEMALGAIQACKAAGIIDKVVVTSWDGTIDACNAVLAGEMRFSMDMGWGKQGVLMVDRIWDTWNERAYAQGQIVPLVRITPDNAEEVKARVTTFVNIAEDFLR